MSTFGLIEYQDALPEVRAIYDDIMATRKNRLDQQFLEGHRPRPRAAQAHLGKHQADYGNRARLIPSPRN